MKATGMPLRNGTSALYYILFVRCHLRFILPWCIVIGFWSTSLVKFFHGLVSSSSCANRAVKLLHSCGSYFTMIENTYLESMNHWLKQRVIVMTILKFRRQLHKQIIARSQNKIHLVVAMDYGLLRLMTEDKLECSEFLPFWLLRNLP